MLSPKRRLPGEPHKKNSLRLSWALLVQFGLLEPWR